MALFAVSPHCNGASAAEGRPTVARLASSRQPVSSRPEEFHLRALPEPCMTLSSHTAPDVRPLP